MSTRASRARRRRTRHVKQLAGPAAWALLALRKRLTRESQQAAQLQEQQLAREAASTDDSRRAAWRQLQREQHEGMLALIVRTKATAERQAARDHELSVQHAALPMIGPAQWSPSSGRDR